MPATLDGLKEIAVIWSAETLRALRSARTLVLLGLYAMACLAVLLFLTLVTGGSRVPPGAMPDLEQLPGVIENVFKVSLFFLPLYIALMGFDQISGEVGPRSIRYLTLRARRSRCCWASSSSSPRCWWRWCSSSTWASSSTPARQPGLPFGLALTC